MQHQWRGVITLGMILLSGNVKSDYPVCSQLGGGREGGGPWRQRERCRLEERFRGRVGLRYQCAEPMAFPQSSWLASGQAARRKRIPCFAARSVPDTEADFHGAFMGCTIYAASPKALPADEASGQDRYYPLPHYHHPHGNCSQRIAACRARSVSQKPLCWGFIKELT